MLLPYQADRTTLLAKPYLCSVLTIHRFKANCLGYSFNYRNLKKIMKYTKTNHKYSMKNFRADGKNVRLKVQSVVCKVAVGIVSFRKFFLYTATWEKFHLVSLVVVPYLSWNYASASKVQGTLLRCFHNKCEPYTWRLNDLNVVIKFHCAHFCI